ncbi:MAG: hypothetical protein JWM40_135, partial [Frankiales bacterium]|nr:hypothetical protein [Frankiales bacterium]
PMTDPVAGGDTPRITPVLLLPAGVSVVAITAAALLGHVLIGLLVAGGVGLGLLNGLLMERATAKITPDSDHEKSDVVKSSMFRLAMVTGLAVVLAVLARPDGWVLLLSLAGYQILVLLSQLGVAAREARNG